MSLSLLRNRSFTQASHLRASHLLHAEALPHASLLHASPPCFTHADAVPPHLPPSSRRSSVALAPPHLLCHGSCKYSATLPPLRCSWLRALSLPSAPSLPLAAAPSDPPQMTQAVLDLVGMSEEVAAWPLPIVFLCFWLGVGDTLLPASASTPRRRLKNHGQFL